MLAPARMINDNEVKIGIHDIGDCVEKTDKLKENNEKIKELQDETDKFNEKYAEKLNNYYKNIGRAFTICTRYPTTSKNKNKINENANNPNYYYPYINISFKIFLFGIIITFFVFYLFWYKNTFSILTRNSIFTIIFIRLIYFIYFTLLLSSLGSLLSLSSLLK